MKKTRNYHQSLSPSIAIGTWKMHIRLSLLWLLLFVNSACSYKQSSKPNRLVLTYDGHWAATIVIPDHPLSACDQNGNGKLSQKKAAEILRQYIAKASGAELPIIPASKTPAKGTLILVGQSSVSDQFNLKPTTKPEGFRIVSFPRGVAILGEIAKADKIENNTDIDLDRGIIHGIHDFLERFVGYRFYFSDPKNPNLDTVIPKCPTIAIDIPVDISDAPVFTQRQLRFASMAAHRPGNIDRRVGGHSHPGRRWNRHYKKSHPEFFLKLPNGKRSDMHLCYSEPGVLKADIKHIADWIDKGVRSPVHNGLTVSKKYIFVGPDDLYPTHGCACDKCQIKKGKSYDNYWSELWWDYVARFAKEVAKRWPEKKVVAMPYTTWLEPPSFDLPDNVCIQLCIHPGAAKTYTHLFMNYQPEIFEKNLSLVKKWSEKLGGNPDRLSIRMYGTNTHTGIPALYANALKRWLLAIRPYCRGFYFDGVYGSGNTPRDYLMTWLWFRLLWNPDLDVDQVIKEHCQYFFGPAATKMEAFYQLLVKTYEKPWPWKQLLRMGGLGFSLEMLYSQHFTPEVLDQLDDDLRNSFKAVELPTDPVWTIPPDSAFVLRNPCGSERTYPVSFTPIDGVAINPAIKWSEGHLVYSGELKSKQRLVIEPGLKATLFDPDGMVKNVTNRINGSLPVLSPGVSTVIYFSSTNASPMDRTRVAMGNAVGFDPVKLDKTVYQRRLQWFRQYFDVHQLGRWGRYSSPDGPQALGRMAQWWLKQGNPEYDVPWTNNTPSANPKADCWKNASTIELVRSSLRAPNNADLNVGFPADLPTKVKLTHDERNLYVLFQCFQPLPPVQDKNAVIVRFCKKKKGLFELAVRPDGTCYKPPLVGWKDYKWRKQGFPSDPKGVHIQTDRHFPSFKTMTIFPSVATCVLVDGSETKDAWKYGLYGGHMPHKRKLYPFISYLRFDIPVLKTDEQLERTIFYGYLRSYLSASTPCRGQISSVVNDQWETTNVKPANMPLKETIILKESGPRNERKGGWFTADLGRYLRDADEGPGHPLTVAISAAPYQGARGFAFSMDKKQKLLPRLELKVSQKDSNVPSWWSVLLTIPREKFGKNFPKKVKVDFARIHDNRYYQATPWLVYVWTPTMTPRRMGFLKFTPKPDKATDKNKPTDKSQNQKRKPNQ